MGVVSEMESGSDMVALLLVLVSMVALSVVATDQAPAESVIHSLPPVPHPAHPGPHPPSYTPSYSPYSPHPPPPPYGYHGEVSVAPLADPRTDLGTHHFPHHGPEAVHGPTLLHHPEPILTHHHLKEYHPYQYDISKIPECAYTNQIYYNLTFCLQDDYYPVDTIKHELERNKPLVDRILNDITYQSADNLVDGLTKAQEEGYTYQHYYGSSKHQVYGEDYIGYTHSPEYYKEGGYVCPSDIFYGRPKRAVNTYGKWKVIVNLPDEYYAQGYGSGYEAYTQTQRLEQCMYPGAPCSYIDPHYHSACLQKHNFARLLAYTYEEGLHIDSFKLPVSCSYHLSQPKHYSPYAAHHADPPVYHPPQPSYHPTHAPAYHPPSPTHILHHGKK